MPKHPSTRVSEDEIRAAESRLDIERLVTMGVEGTRIETFEFPTVQLGGPSCGPPNPPDARRAPGNPGRSSGKRDM